MTLNRLDMPGDQQADEDERCVRGLSVSCCSMWSVWLSMKPVFPRLLISGQIFSLDSRAKVTAPEHLIEFADYLVMTDDESFTSQPDLAKKSFVFFVVDPTITSRRRWMPSTPCNPMDRPKGEAVKARKSQGRLSMSELIERSKGGSPARLNSPRTSPGQVSPAPLSHRTVMSLVITGVQLPGVCRPDRLFSAFQR